MTNRTWSAQLRRQEELEEIGTQRGRERFLSNLRKASSKGQEARLGGGRSLLLKALDSVEDGLKKWLADTNEYLSKKGGIRPIAHRWLSLLEPEVISYLTLKVLLDGMHQPRSVYQVATAVAQRIEDELVYRELKAKKPALFKYLMTESFGTDSYSYRQRALKGVIRSNDIDVSHLRIPRSDKMHVGVKCVDFVILHTGLFKAELVTLRSGANMKKFRANSKRDQWRIVAEQSTLDWVSSKNEALEWLTPMALPMVVPPLPWGPGGQLGGYRYALMGKYPLVRGVSKAQRELVDGTDMPLVYGAVNALQETPWTINTFILDVMQRIRESGGNCAGIPRLEPEPMPARPQDIETNVESRKAWRTATHATISRNKAMVIESLKFLRLLREVDIVKDESNIFFPYNLDFRGRLYPIATNLSPQGDDLCKGLLLFAEGKPLGYKGIEALRIFGANCMDSDGGVKLTHQSTMRRQHWVKENAERIRECAEDPLSYTWWMSADKPFQFLAFCKEYTEAVDSGDPEGYVCGLPVYIDGSCNGLQHFSAMFRDEVGGEAVNLVPADTPQDIYQKVCDAVTKRLQAVTPKDPEFSIARRWLSSGLLTRKLFKRPTMTFGYGSKVYGFQDQLIDFLQTENRETWDQTKAHFTIDGSEQVLQACRFLSVCIWDALGSTVVKAFEGMEWLQSCAKTVCNGAKDGVRWTVPFSGFPVKQEYMQYKVKQVHTILSGSIVRPALYEPTAKPLARKQQNAVSPNVIHSLDAAALMLTVDMAVNSGITSFSGIHDSYGTVPADVSKVHRHTRAAFAMLYGYGDVVNDLKKQFEEQAGKPMPVPPEDGKLDIELVHQSPYFFA